MDERVAFFRIDGAGGSEQATKSPPAREPSQAVAAPTRGPAAKKSPVAAPKQQPAAAPKRVAAGANGGGPVGRMQTALATAVNSEPDWKQF